MTIDKLIEQHRATLDAATAANADRAFFAHWPEAPSGKIYGETANADGEAAFKAQLNAPFQGLMQSGGEGSVGQETSPFGFALGVTYPKVGVDVLIERATSAQVTWQALTPDARAAILIEALEQGAKRFFEIGYATVHTTGQGFVMAFQSSGPHAFDRALEAVAMGHAAQTTFASDVRWTKPMGKMEVSIAKTFRIVPKGINLVIGCSTFPVWNTVPGMFAGLATGNAVIVKPHPGAVYPIAIVVAVLQQTLQSLGLDPHVCQLAVDTVEHPITLDLVRHPSVRVIDYTGGPHFGDIVEREGAAHGKTVFTEKAGVNCVILDSANDLDKALENVAFSLSLYGGQMCTAPQNIFIARDGMLVGGERVGVEDVAIKLREKIDALVLNEKMGPGTVGTIQNERTLARVDEAKALGLPVLRDSAPIPQPGFDKARSVSPLVLRADASRADIYEREWFGPISFVITVDNFDEAVALVAKSVRTHGALTTSFYCTDDAKAHKAEDAIIAAGAPVAFNFDSYVWVNQSAAFSDFHGAGCNPAGNATFADQSFVTNRFNVVGVRRQA
jgi:phenylacetic acid degradation protein paaN